MKKNENTADNEIAKIIKEFPKYRNELRAELYVGFKARVDRLFEMLDATDNSKEFIDSMLKIADKILPRLSEDGNNFDNEPIMIKFKVVDKLYKEE